MILAAYRNPPYRSPTPRTSNNGTNDSRTASRSPSSTNSNSHNDPTKKATALTPPPSLQQQQHTLETRSQSPKRKRQGLERQASLPSDLPSSTLPTMLSVVTGTTSTVTGIAGQEVVESGADSPRTKVAERFKGLEVQDVSANHGGLGESPSPRKKIKFADVDGDDVSTPPKPLSSQAQSRELEVPDSKGPNSLEMAHQTTISAMDLGVMREIEMDSPSPSPAPPPPNPRRTFTKVPSLRKESSYLSTRESPPSSQDQVQAQLPTSSPPQKRRLSSPTLETMALDPTPLAVSNDATSLTWSWSEITGHDIDTSNHDDDGEGINGIGFKPTPAMAAARKLKRKKQVEEWKTREAREARQRRAEERRRREGVGGSTSVEGGGDEKRVVRFVDW